MKKTIFMLLMAGAVVAISLSCKKENRIERNLWNQGGEWNIESLYFEEHVDEHYNSYTDYNLGVITFNKGGDGSIRYDDGDIETFTYSNTEKTLTISYNSWQTVVYDIAEWKKDRLTLSGKYTSDDIDFKDVYTLKKK